MSKDIGDNKGFETTEEIKGFTPKDEEVTEILKKYGHDITLVVFMGNIDDAPVFGVKVVGKDQKNMFSGQALGNVFMKYLKSQFEDYVNQKN